ncbi:hypothetical protein R3P38DRAFT_3255589 [Favolaschia claudopus]|uniref:Secreted protein n=1 Tax=Favolaschia claudopus TaxID=2862362 RepID=A0AAW0DMJ1_9AGAR
MFAPVTLVQMQSHTVTFLTLTSVCAASRLNRHSTDSIFDVRSAGLPIDLQHALPGPSAQSVVCHGLLSPVPV